MRGQTWSVASRLLAREGRAAEADGVRLDADESTDDVWLANETAACKNPKNK